jgi:hypothetical protein
VLVTDEESAIQNAIKLKLPGIPAFLCWRHVTNAIDRWIHSHKGKTLDRIIYKSDILTLLKLRTRSDFDKEYNVMKLTWDEAFRDYIDKFIIPSIDRIGRWTLDEYALYNNTSDYGLTTNIGEGTNNFIHQLLPNETMIDQAVLVIQNWMKTKCNELYRGFALLGTYTLKPEYREYQLMPEYIEDELRECYSTTDMVEEARMQLRTLLDTQTLTTSASQSSLDTSATQSSLDTSVSVDELPESTASTSADAVEQAPVEQTPSVATASARQLLACWILRNDKIKFDAQGHCFTVNYNGLNSLVHLFPSETCTCPARVDCAHIQAVKMAIGMPRPEPKFSRANLTKLRRNANNNVVAGRKARGHKTNSE